ncbi:hypothetical protein [Streptomyces yaizuensis]|uniref:Integral membrane protein n=1 Tax=Streptomyces yaizuensis TaxID=2989713 RepID=A0ABQ5PBF2_9ACTN|nr:hypothetical protein [Streptomyces sp. YSPA8]GLF99925.1 hypothetical protein SYYSPA8_36530 [Streptomyces sp. YSPA8]
MSITTASRSARPVAYRVLPGLRIAALLFAVPALFSGAAPLLALAFVTIAGLGTWMLALALGKGGARPGSLRTRATLALVTDGLAMIAAAGFFIGVLTTGSITAAATTYPGFLAISIFGVLSFLHHKAHSIRRTRRR